MKHIDGLVLTGFANSIALQAPGGELAHLEKLAKHAGPEHEHREEILAGVAFINLGATIAQQVFGVEELPDVDSGNPYHIAETPAISPNPYMDRSRAVADGVSPYASGDSVDVNAKTMAGAALLLDRTVCDVPFSYLEYTVGKLFNGVESEAQEFFQKMKIADEVYNNRGQVPYEAYDSQELMAAFREFDLDDIPPDTVAFSPELEVLQEGYDLGQLAARAGLNTHTEQQPYYSTFQIGKNVVTLLGHALEDIHELGEQLKNLD